MKKLLKVSLAGAMALSLAACGSKSSSSSSGSGLSEWHTYQTAVNEMETWNVFYSQSAADLDVLTNCIDSLLTNDTEGKLVGNIAKTWEANEDSTVWTFHLNEGVKWVDYTGEEVGEVTAQDFITGLEYCLNYAKNDGANTSMPIEMIAGAEDYYNKTKEEAEANGSVSQETIDSFTDIVGIKAVDDYTLEYTMVSPKPYFDTLTTYAPLYPLDETCVDTYGDKYGTDNTTIFYCGPYVCTEYTNKSSKTLTKNKDYWNLDNVKLFDQVTVSMVEDTSLAWSLFQSGEIDNITLNEDILTEINKAGEGSEYYDYLVEAKPTKYSYVMRFNYNSKLEDGSDDVNWNTAIANENFRKAIYYGVDWTDYIQRVNSINPGHCLNDAMTMSGLCFTSDGTNYTDLVKDRLGYESDTDSSDSVHARLDADKAQECIDAAKEELTAAGVSLPVTLWYTYPAGNSVSADTASIFKQMIEEQLGDLITVDFRTYTSSFSTEIRKPELFSVFVSGWGADYGDPINYLVQETDTDNSFYNYNYCNLTEEIDPDFGTFCDMVEEANAMTDLDERYNAFADAEAYYIEHAWGIPLYYQVSWEITRVNDYSKINAVYGMQNSRYVNWETTSDTAYTTEEYEAFKAAE